MATYILATVKIDAEDLASTVPTQCRATEASDAAAVRIDCTLNEARGYQCVGGVAARLEDERAFVCSLRLRRQNQTLSATHRVARLAIVSRKPLQSILQDCFQDSECGAEITKKSSHPGKKRLEFLSR